VVTKENRDDFCMMSRPPRESDTFVTEFRL